MLSLAPLRTFAQETVKDCGSAEVLLQLNGRVQLNVPLPGLTDAVRCKTDEGGIRTYHLVISEPGNELSTYLRAFYVYFVWIVGILATVMIMFAGIRWITAAGNTSQIQNAKTTMNGAVIGLVLTLTSYVILQAINPELVRLRVPFVEGVTPIYTGDYCKVIKGVDYQELATKAGVKCGEVFQYEDKLSSAKVICMSQYCAEAGKTCLTCKGPNDPFLSCDAIGYTCGYYEAPVVISGTLLNPADVNVQKVQLWSFAANFGNTRGLLDEFEPSGPFVDGTQFTLDSGGEDVTLGQFYLKLIKSGEGDCESREFTVPVRVGQPGQRSVTIAADDCALTEL